MALQKHKDAIKGALKHKRVIENFFSLSILNGLTFLLPLITLPFIVRIIGPEKYGIYAITLVVVQYINMVSIYGFTYSGTRLISQNRDNLPLLGKYFSSIIVTRLCLSLLCLAIIFGSSIFIPFLANERLSFVYAIGMVLGDVFVPAWFFQGMERMKYVTIVNVTSKGLFTVLIFFTISNANDYPLIFLVTSVGSIIAGLLSVVLVFWQFKIPFVIPSIKDIKFQLRDGWQIFLSSVSINMFRSTNTIILGLLTSNYYVGIYSVAERIIKALQSLVSPLSDALFPFFSLKFKEMEVSTAVKQLFGLAKYYFVGLFGLSAMVFLFSPIIGRLMLGEEFSASIVNLRILSFVVLFGGMNYLLGIIGMVNLGYEKYFTRFVFITGAVSIILVSVGALFLNDLAGSIGLLLGEVLLFGLIVRFLNKRTNATT